MASRKERQRRILEIVAHNQVDSQEQLQALLLADGLECSQTTLSRDLRHLGLVKQAGVYRAPRDREAAPDALAHLASDLAARLQAADAGGSVVVLRVAKDPTGVAERIDRAAIPAIVAAVACGEIVLVVTRSPADARHVAGALQPRHRRRHA